MMIPVKKQMKTAINFEHLAASMYDGLYVVDTRKKIIYWNKAAEAITGYSAEEVMGKSCADGILMHVDSRGHGLCNSMCPMSSSIKDGQPRIEEVFLLHKDGHRVPVTVRISPLRNSRNRIVAGIQLFTDNRNADTFRVKAAEFRRLALLDELTSMPNRRHLKALLDIAITQVRHSGVRIGFLFFDIDHLKHFNDKYGHHVGDQAIRTVANTLLNSARPFDSFARWGGDEFAGLFPHTDIPALHRIAGRLCSLVRRSRVDDGEKHMRVTISIGGTVIRPGDSVDSLLKRADHMMYRSKKEGRNRASITCPG
jgi:diguanylate cyclase (GGDEF)-like protein/PAS domain S-box-containing protein